MSPASGNKNDLDPDRVVGSARAGIPGREVQAVLLGREGHQPVVYGSPGNAQATKGLVDLLRLRAAQRQWRLEPRIQQTGGVLGGKPGIAWQPREYGVGLSQRMPAQRELLPAPPSHHVGVMLVRPDQQRNRDAGVDRDGHLRPASMRLKRTSSSTGVSPAATSTPSSSTRRAVRPAGSTCTPAPYGEM